MGRLILAYVAGIWHKDTVELHIIPIALNLDYKYNKDNA